MIGEIYNVGNYSVELHDLTPTRLGANWKFCNSIYVAVHLTIVGTNHQVFSAHTNIYYVLYKGAHTGNGFL